MHALSETALRIRQSRFPEATTIFLAGSLVRGEGTSTSDLDMVVLYEHLSSAYRESFIFENWPVEAFVHDPQTLEYFFKEVDRPTGFPSLAAMVAEGIEVPEANAFTHLLKQRASEILEEGPPKWTAQETDKSRYFISDLTEDLKDPRSSEEMHATATRLYSALADHYFRTKNLWSAQGKTIPRRLHAVDAAFAEQFLQGFEQLFSRNCPKAVIELAENILEPDGGFLFEGFRLEAPKNWRVGGPPAKAKDAR